MRTDWLIPEQWELQILITIRRNLWISSLVWITPAGGCLCLIFIWPWNRHKYSYEGFHSVFENSRQLYENYGHTEEFCIAWIYLTFYKTNKDNWTSIFFHYHSSSLSSRLLTVDSLNIFIQLASSLFYFHR